MHSHDTFFRVFFFAQPQQVLDFYSAAAVLVRSLELRPAGFNVIFGEALISVFFFTILVSHLFPATSPQLTSFRLIASNFNFPRHPWTCSQTCSTE